MLDWRRNHFQAHLIIGRIYSFLACWTESLSFMLAVCQRLPCITRHVGLPSMAAYLIRRTSQEGSEARVLYNIITEVTAITPPCSIGYRQVIGPAHPQGGDRCSRHEQESLSVISGCQCSFIWECFYFTIIYEGYLHWTWNSRLVIFFLQHFKNKFPFPSGIHRLWWEILTRLNYYFPYV